jgi:hypothetical protein
MKGPYNRYATTQARPATSNDIRRGIELVNNRYGVHYRCEVQGADADPGTEPPVYILLHGGQEVARGSIQSVYDRLVDAYNNGGTPCA